MRQRMLALPALSVVALIILGLTGCATTEQGPIVAQAQAAPPSPPPPSGPKKRIAVAKFDATGAFVAQYGGWDIGGGLAAQLTTALVNSGHFIVVERSELASVLREQELGLQKIVPKETAAQVGQLLGAQILVRGAVTEFEQKAGGGGLRLGVGTGILGGALGLQSVTGHTGIDVRLIDTTTGEVLQSRRAEAKVERSGVSADISVSQVTFGGDKFSSTPLGLATRQAIEQAVAFVTQAMGTVPWSARVVEVVGEQVYINAGTSSNVRPGDIFKVTTVVRELKDPTTGALLGVEESPLGEIQVVSVQEKFSIARMKTPFPTKRGDLVKLPGQ